MAASPRADFLVVVGPASNRTAFSWPKRCGCGKQWPFEAWTTLAYCGVMGDGLRALELRHCACGSTLSVPHVALVLSTERPANDDD